MLSELTTLLQEIRSETRARVEAELDLDRYEELEPKVRERLEDQMEARIEGEYRVVRRGSRRSTVGPSRPGDDHAASRGRIDEPAGLP